MINVGDKYKQKPFHCAKISAKDALKIALNRAIKTVKLTSDSINNKNADKVRGLHHSVSSKRNFDAQIQKGIEFDKKSIEKPN